MGLKEILYADLLRTKTKDWISGYLPPERTPTHEKIEEVSPNSNYITVWLKSARIVNVRSGFSRFFGMVHCHSSLSVRGQTEPAQFHYVSTPTKLQNADPKRLPRVIDVNHEVLGPIPYTGGSLKVETGLFSVKSGDLVQPYLEVMDNLASLAGVSYVQVAKPFVAPIQKGIDLLLTGGGDEILEIGLARSFNPIKTGYFVFLRATKEELNPEDLKVVGDDFRLVGADDKPIEDYPYVVFQITASSKRADCLSIPEIKDAHEKLRAEERKGNIKEAQDAFAAFRRIALTSYDLLPAHAKELVDEIKTEMESVLGPATQAKRGKRPHLRPLSQVPVSFR